eukprot:TRINITY_DN4616_c0_g1_i1.p1 TRINITY_DN4616_c0_g1~~TRINITY_DN4616_c0_g1_i1.p1  ORF type:complete len:452 (-),score=82.44 TRINITY_DN4616_c0_g1_i1:161-1516(-)
MAGPLTFAVGAGALAGSAFAMYQESERRHIVNSVRENDAQMQDLLGDVEELQRLNFSRSGMSDDTYVWVLLVHVGDAHVSRRLHGKHLRVRVKYGAQGWSLRRATESVQAVTNSEGLCHVPFNQTLAFVWRRSVSPIIRLRLFTTAARYVELTLGKTEFTFKFTGIAGFQEKDLHLEGSATGSGSTLRVVAEMRAVRLGDIREHGFSVGQVVPPPRLAEPTAMYPLLKGEAVEAAPGFEPPPATTAGSGGHVVRAHAASEVATPNGSSDSSALASGVLVDRGYAPSLPSSSLGQGGALPSRSPGSAPASASSATGGALPSRSPGSAPASASSATASASSSSPASGVALPGVMSPSQAQATPTPARTGAVGANAVGNASAAAGASRVMMRASILMERPSSMSDSETATAPGTPDRSRAASGSETESHSEDCEERGRRGRASSIGGPAGCCWH